LIFVQIGIGKLFLTLSEARTAVIRHNIPVAKNSRARIKHPAPKLDPIFGAYGAVSTSGGLAGARHGSCTRMAWKRPFITRQRAGYGKKASAMSLFSLGCITLQSAMSSDRW